MGPVSYFGICDGFLRRFGARCLGVLADFFAYFVEITVKVKANMKFAKIFEAAEVCLLSNTRGKLEPSLLIYRNVLERILV